MTMYPSVGGFFFFLLSNWRLRRLPHFSPEWVAHPDFHRSNSLVNQAGWLPAAPAFCGAGGWHGAARSMSWNSGAHNLPAALCQFHSSLYAGFTNLSAEEVNGLFHILEVEVTWRGKKQRVRAGFSLWLHVINHLLHYITAADTK